MCGSFTVFPCCGEDLTELGPDCSGMIPERALWKRGDGTNGKASCVLGCEGWAPARPCVLVFEGKGCVGWVYF